MDHLKQGLEKYKQEVGVDQLVERVRRTERVHQLFERQETVLNIEKLCFFYTLERMVQFPWPIYHKLYVTLEYSCDNVHVENKSICPGAFKRSSRTVLQLPGLPLCIKEQIVAYTTPTLCVSCLKWSPMIQAHPLDSPVPSCGCPPVDTVSLPVLQLTYDQEKEERDKLVQRAKKAIDHPDMTLDNKILLSNWLLYRRLPEFSADLVHLVDSFS